MLREIGERRSTTTNQISQNIGDFPHMYVLSRRTDSKRRAYMLGFLSNLNAATTFTLFDSVNGDDPRQVPMKLIKGLDQHISKLQTIEYGKRARPDFEVNSRLSSIP